MFFSSSCIEHVCIQPPIHEIIKTLPPCPQITWTALSTGRHVSLTDATRAQEVVVSYLPLSHIAAQMVDIWVTMRVGGATHFAQPDALKVR